MSWFSSIKNIFSVNKDLTQAPTLIKEQIRKVLYEADLGPQVTEELVSTIKDVKDLESTRVLIEEKLVKIISSFESHIELNSRPYVIMLMGVNGVGKTTTAAKLANHYQNEHGKKVLLCGADTFRAAAVEQLEHWAKKIGCGFFSKGSGTDPGATAYESVQKAIKESYDLLIIDMGGRLHTQQALMDELQKVYRAIGKVLNGAPHQNLLVVDSTQGQNIFNQVETFNTFTKLTGIILTKFDGTAKGGAVVRTLYTFKKPLLFIGYGEGVKDIDKFNAKQFINKFW